MARYTANGDDEERVERDGVPIDVEDGDDLVTASTGSYPRGLPGLQITLNRHYVGEVIDEDIQDDAEALLEVALERALNDIDVEGDR